MTAAIVDWNTVYLDRAVRHLRAQGVSLPDELLAHVTPLGWSTSRSRATTTGRQPRRLMGSGPLRDVRAAFLPLAA